jgi:hypothetical protein
MHIHLDPFGFDPCRSRKSCHNKCTSSAPDLRSERRIDARGAVRKHAVDRGNVLRQRVDILDMCRRGHGVQSQVERQFFVNNLTDMMVYLWKPRSLANLSPYSRIVTPMRCTIGIDLNYNFHQLQKVKGSPAVFPRDVQRKHSSTLLPSYLRALSVVLALGVSISVAVGSARASQAEVFTRPRPVYLEEMRG